MSLEAAEITQVLDRWEQGDAAAGDRLFPLVYNELRRRAQRLMAGERPDHTLGQTALVHEAYLRLVRPGAAYESRLHFLNAAALAMRRILIDYAEARGAAKRGGGLQRATDVDAAALADAAPDIDVAALGEALDELARFSPRQADVVNLRFFAGMRDQEIASLLEVSEKTVRRDWAAARLWLFDRMRDEPGVR